MNPTINLLFGVHNHQPVGNFEGVFNRADHDCYRPFIDILYEHPEIKATLHFSGSLIDWLLKNDPTLLRKVKEMTKRHQVEILTGGYYEPILPVIPERDMLGQINMLNEFIKDYFEYEPKGAWIGERVWEPHIVKTLAHAGVKYILLDDFHLFKAGIKEENLLGYYLTEEAGKSIAVFPISKRLRYTIPFAQPSETIEYLRSKACEQGKGAATIVDDGEKFGLWPGTHRLVYQKMWLKRFFQLLLKNEEWLKTQTISEYMRRHKPLGTAQLPSASYEEMMAWSGGSFRNFFSKYPEVNNLHKRMLYVSDKLDKEKGENKEARRYLYMGQTNCPYWHGVFGGIYLGHLRHVAYKNLIYSQSLLEKKKGSAWIETELFDFDQDGAQELLIKNPALNVFVAPKLGGGIFELDYIPKSINLVDVMTRRPESYHEKIKAGPKKPFQLKKNGVINIHDLLGSKERGLEKFLIYDSYRRTSGLDHFFPKEMPFKDFKNGRYEELGDFINAQYSLKQNKTKQGVSIILHREGKINYNGKKIPLALSKEISLNNRDAQISLEYNLNNLSGQPIEIVFAVEFNISPEDQVQPNSLRCNGETKEAVHSLKEDVQAGGIRDVHLQDKISGLECAFYFDKSPNLWSFPLETVSASERGFERNYQQTVILPCWPIRLEKSWQGKITVAVSG